MPDKISRDHLQRRAYIYVRQSSRQQMLDHCESQDIQRQLAHRAVVLGWSVDRVEVIDCDLGLSASGSQARPGFQHLLHHICQQQAGAVFFWNASRLARNSQDWHQMLSVCRIFGTLVIDHEGIYDPRQAGDQLFLGMKGAISEYEMQHFQALAQAATLNKARRGELFRIVPAGFVKTREGKVEQDPDERVRQAIHTVFDRFDQLGTVRQVKRWYAENELDVPVRDCRFGPDLIWRRPSKSTICQILTNPIYAGAYVYPRRRTVSRLVNGGIKKTRQYVPLDQVEVLIKDCLPGYITWQQFERNRQRLTANVPPSQPSPGPARKGTGILTGLLHCGYCGRRLGVRYKKAGSAPYYYCKRQIDHPTQRLTFNGLPLERQVIDQLLAVVQPMGIEAAIRAQDRQDNMGQQKRRALELALEQARYEADRIERQLHQVEPEKRLVFQTLSQRWEDALTAVSDAERRYEQAQCQMPDPADIDRQRLFQLGADLKQAWDDPACPNTFKTQIARTLIAEIWIKPLPDDRFEATLHWVGGVHTRLTWQPSTYHRSLIPPDQPKTIPLIRQLTQTCADDQIARVLNLLKHPDKSGQTWSQDAVSRFRHKHNIPAFSPEAYAAKGWVSLTQAARILGISPETVKRLIRAKVIPANQAIAYAPWVIEQSVLERDDVRQIVADLKKTGKILIHKGQENLSV